MAEIKKIYEDSERTQEIYPITHEKAVIDNNGTTAETKFQMIKELINQKQMEVGAVPSDLTPTEGSTNWVTSGGVFDNSIRNSTFKVDNANTGNGYTLEGRFILDDAWTANNKAVMFMLPRPTNCDNIKIVSNNFTRIAFLEDNITTLSESPSYCLEYDSVIVLENETKTFSIPDDCNFIYLDYSYDGIDRMPHSMQFIFSVKNGIDKLNAVVKSIQLEGSLRLRVINSEMHVVSGLSYVYPINPCQKIEIVGKANFVWLKTDVIQIGDDYNASDYFHGWCECDEEGAELYAAPDCHYIMVEGNADVYAFDDYKDFSEHKTDLLSIASYVANRSVRYMYHTYIRTMHGGGYKNPLTGIGTTNEMTHRCPAALVSHIEVMLNSPTLDLGLIGTTKYALRNQCVRYLQALVAEHSKWTNKWESSITAAYMGSSSCRLYRDGYMEQQLYDSIRNVVSVEADNILSKQPGDRWRDNAVFGIYWKNINGTELYPGDSKSEEVGWYGGCLGTACALCQDYPNINEYRRKFIEYSIISYASPDDIGKNETYNGYSLTSLQGSNITNDGIVINHNIIHPDYMASRCFVLFFSLRALNYANISLPKAMLFNMQLVLSAYTNYKFTSEKYLNKYQPIPPYGVIVPDGSNYPYFPMGNDWGTLRQDPEAQFFSMLYALSQSPRYDCSRVAKAYLATIKKLQDRFETSEQSGRIVANSSENSYGYSEDSGLRYANVGSTMVCPVSIVEIMTSDLVWSDDDWFNVNN